MLLLAYYWTFPLISRLGKSWLMNGMLLGRTILAGYELLSAGLARVGSMEAGLTEVEYVVQYAANFSIQQADWYET